MSIFVFILIAIGAFFVGTIGFCQIVGTIKYHKTFRLSHIAFTISIWSFILCLGIISVVKWIDDCILAVIIAYILSFLLSLSTKSDSESVKNNTITPVKKPISQKDESIKKLQEMYDNAVRDLGDLTIEDAEQMYLENKITAEYKDELINNIGALNYVIETYPSLIQELKNKL